MEALSGGLRQSLRGVTARAAVAPADGALTVLLCLADGAAGSTERRNIGPHQEPHP